MSILESFSADRPRQSLAEISGRVGLPRGTTHRLLTTFEELGYIHNDGGSYELTPRSLNMGYAYLGSQSLPDIGLAVIRRLSNVIDEHTSVGVLDGDSVLIVAATTPRRSIAVFTVVGQRLPLATSATGRALMSSFDDHELAARCLSAGFSRSECDVAVAESSRVRDRGYALADETVESGLVSIAAPVRAPHGSIVAAVAVAVPKSRYDASALETAVSRQLIDAAGEIERSLQHCD